MACTNKAVASSCTNPGYANTGGSMAMAVLGHVQLHTMAMPTGAEVSYFSKNLDLCITTQT